MEQQKKAANTSELNLIQLINSPRSNAQNSRILPTNRTKKYLPGSFNKSKENEENRQYVISYNFDTTQGLGHCTHNILIGWDEEHKIQRKNIKDKLSRNPFRNHVQKSSVTQELKKQEKQLKQIRKENQNSRSTFSKRTVYAPGIYENKHDSSENNMNSKVSKRNNDRFSGSNHIPSLSKNNHSMGKKTVISNNLPHPQFQSKNKLIGNGFKNLESHNFNKMEPLLKEQKSFQSKNKQKYGNFPSKFGNRNANKAGNINKNIEKDMKYPIFNDEEGNFCSGEDGIETLKLIKELQKMENSEQQEAQENKQNIQKIRKNSKQTKQRETKVERRGKTPQKDLGRIDSKEKKKNSTMSEFNTNSVAERQSRKQVSIKSGKNNNSLHEKYKVPEEKQNSQSDRMKQDSLPKQKVLDEKKNNQEKKFKRNDSRKSINAAQNKRKIKKEQQQNLEKQRKKTSEDRILAKKTETQNKKLKQTSLKEQKLSKGKHNDRKKESEEARKNKSLQLPLKNISSNKIQNPNSGRKMSPHSSFRKDSGRETPINSNQRSRRNFQKQIEPKLSKQKKVLKKQEKCPSRNQAGRSPRRKDFSQKSKEEKNLSNRSMSSKSSLMSPRSPRIPSMARQKSRSSRKLQSQNQKKLQLDQFLDEQERILQKKKQEELNESKENIFDQFKDSLQLSNEQSRLSQKKRKKGEQINQMNSLNIENQLNRKNGDSFMDKANMTCQANLYPIQQQSFQIQDKINQTDFLGQNRKGRRNKRNTQKLLENLNNFERAPILSYIYLKQERFISVENQFEKSETRIEYIEFQNDFNIQFDLSNLVQKSLNIILSLNSWLIKRIYEPYMDNNGNSQLWLYCKGLWMPFSALHENSAIKLLKYSLAKSAEEVYYSNLQNLGIQQIIRMITGLHVLQLRNHRKLYKQLSFNVKKGNIIKGISSNFKKPIYSILGVQTTPSQERIIQIQKDSKDKNKVSDPIWVKQSLFRDFFDYFMLIGYRNVSYWMCKELSFKDESRIVYIIESIKNTSGSLQIHCEEQIQCEIELYREIKPKMLKFVGKINEKTQPKKTIQNPNPAAYFQFLLKGRYYLFISCKKTCRLAIETSDKLTVTFLQHLNQMKSSNSQYIQISKKTQSNNSSRPVSRHIQETLKERFIEYLVQSSRGKL